MRTLKLPRNIVGRDFVVGDIHGHFDLLDLFLKEVAFDMQKDRLFSVGDLIDRGPYSLHAGAYLQQEWFYSVKGNHETLLLDALAKTPGIWDVWMQVGGNWSQFAAQSELEELADLLNELPYLIEVPTAHGSVGIVHADVPVYHRWPDLFERTTQGRLSGKEINTLIWSRQRYRRLSLSLLDPGSCKPQPVEDIHRVYVGHSIVRSPQSYGNVMFIDTGAFNAGRLTAIELDSEEIISIENPTPF